MVHGLQIFFHSYVNIHPFLLSLVSALLLYDFLFFFGQMQLRPMCRDIKKCVEYGSYGNTKLPVNSDLLF